MFCQKCGNKINDGAAFCNNCGQPVMSANNTYNAVPTNPTYDRQIQNYGGFGGTKSTNTTNLILIIVICMLCVVFICVAVFVLMARNSAYTDTADDLLSTYSTYKKKKALSDVQVDAYNVYTCVQAMAEDGKDITAESISEEAGICVDDTNRKCEAYINVVVDMDDNRYVTYYEYYDIGSDICVYFDYDNVEWLEMNVPLTGTTIEINN
jgi:uncharacterized membrane protein YvbJ